MREIIDGKVLSACNTASGDGAGAEAISGLGRRFFYAGSRALLVTHWPVGREFSCVHPLFWAPYALVGDGGR